MCEKYSPLPIGGLSAGFSKWAGESLGIEANPLRVTRYAAHMAVGGMAGAIGAVISGSDPFSAFGIGAAVAAVAYRFNHEASEERTAKEVQWWVNKGGLGEDPDLLLYDYRKVSFYQCMQDCVGSLPWLTTTVSGASEIYGWYNGSGALTTFIGRATGVAGLGVSYMCSGVCLMTPNGKQGDTRVK